MNELINLVLVMSCFASVFILGELTMRFYSDLFISRKMVHIASAIVASFLPFFISWMMAVFVGFIFCLILLLNLRFDYLKSVKQLPDNYGSVLFPLGLILAALIDWTHFSTSVLILGFADGFAGLIGYCVSRQTKHKTWVGSMVFFIVTFFILLATKYQFSWWIVVVSLVLMIVELKSVNGWDNLLVPIVASVLVRILV